MVKLERIFPLDAKKYCTQLFHVVFKRDHEKVHTHLRSGNNVLVLLWEKKFT